MIYVLNGHYVLIMLKLVQSEIESCLYTSWERIFPRVFHPSES
jgi:hypothetical protein